VIVRSKTAGPWKYLRAAPYIAKTLGWRWLAFRLAYAIKLRSGHFRRKLPVRAWEEIPLAENLSDSGLGDPVSYLEHRKKNAPAFFFSAQDLPTYRDALTRLDQDDGKVCISLANNICEGHFLFFGHHLVATGFPPSWHTNYLSEEEIDARRHWSEIGDFAWSDIKVVWELNRFGFTYPLVRAYWRTGDERYPELFWQLVEDWRQHNPPQQGPNWKCGQEIALRLMAWCFGLYGFISAEATTPERVAALAQMACASTHRIEANIDYALIQRNNHGMSEAAGLWTIGLLFPEFKESGRWRQKGRILLEELGRDLIYDDGSFVQHSFNYQRLMLHLYLWAIRLGELNDCPVSSHLRERVAKVAELLYQVQDESTGRVPNYGQNDGSLILPLSNCDYHDFRPVIQAAYYLSNGRRCYKSGPWDEELLWLFGPESLASACDKPERSDLHAEVGGYYVLRGEDSFVFTRCGTFRDRPSQADVLHLDLWWRGINIAIDPGTYSYNAPSPWDNPFAHTRFHNTVAVDGLDQMDRVGPFLWFPWVQGRTLVTRTSATASLKYWEGTHDGYKRLPDPVAYRRGVLKLPEDSWLIIDGLDASVQHEYRVNWLFSDWPHRWDGAEGRLRLETSAGIYHCQFLSPFQRAQSTFVRADENEPRGWHAPYYSHREPALSLEMSVRSASVRFLSLFSPRNISWRGGDDRLEFFFGSQLVHIQVNAAIAAPLLAAATISHPTESITLT